jgi:hypothetical protein
MRNAPPFNLLNFYEPMMKARIQENLAGPREKQLRIKKWREFFKNHLN